MPSTAAKSATGNSDNSNRQEQRDESNRTPEFQNAAVLNLPDNAKNYEEVDVIGTGAYGTVYKARDLANEGQFVALKKLRVPLTDDGVPMSTLREISLLKNLESFEHPNIVRLFDICHGRRLEQEQQLILFLVFEHVEQDLAQYLARCPSPGLGPDRIKDILFQLLSGVDFLHSNRVVHRDLKPQNILVTNQGQVKLADFGLARIYDSQIVLTSVVVTLWYRSPEVLLQATYDTSVDIWSCGCIFAELFRRSPLFDGHSEVDQLVKIFEILGTPQEHQWPENVSLPWTSFQYHQSIPIERKVPEICTLGKNLLEKMLVFDPSRRISASDALSHDYFRKDNMYPVEWKLRRRNPSTPTSSSSGASSNTSTPDSMPEK
ncbi:CDK6 (predicted) [Pycnogonum litorale]